MSATANQAVPTLRDLKTTRITATYTMTTVAEAAASSNIPTSTVTAGEVTPAPATIHLPYKPKLPARTVSVAATYQDDSGGGSSDLEETMTVMAVLKDEFGKYTLYVQCQKDHALSKCPGFRAFNDAQRAALIKKTRTCYRCIQGRHPRSDCPRNWTYRECGSDQAATATTTTQVVTTEATPTVATSTASQPSISARLDKIRALRTACNTSITATYEWITKVQKEMTALISCERTNQRLTEFLVTSAGIEAGIEYNMQVYANAVRHIQASKSVNALKEADQAKRNLNVTRTAMKFWQISYLGSKGNLEEQQLQPVAEPSFRATQDGAPLYSERQRQERQFLQADIAAITSEGLAFITTPPTSVTPATSNKKFRVNTVFDTCAEGCFLTERLATILGLTGTKDRGRYLKSHGKVILVSIGKAKGPKGARIDVPKKYPKYNIIDEDNEVTNKVAIERPQRGPTLDETDAIADQVNKVAIRHPVGSASDKSMTSTRVSSTPNHGD
jgi:hypothetical protein